MKGIDALRQFQTGITAIIGFAGVIITLLANARLARRARADGIDHERQTLRTALIVELTMLRDAYAQNAEYCAEYAAKPGGAFDVPLFGMTDIYDAMLGKIGLLSSEQVSSVVNAYATHRQVSHVIVSIFEGVPVPSSKGVRVLASRAQELQKIYAKTVPGFDAALVALGALAKSKSH